MAKNKDLETKNKLDRLANVLGEGMNTSLKSSASDKVVGVKAKRHGTFKTGEVIIILLVIAVIGLVMGSALTYKLLDGNVGQKIDSNLQEFINNYQYIIDNYNGELDKEALLDDALQGMLSGLDPNSLYLNSDAFQNFNIFLEGSYQGIGIEVYNDKDNNVIIYKVFENSPAASAGLKSGDVITKVNGKSVLNTKTSKLIEQIKSLEGKKIKITYLRDGKEYNVEIKSSKVNIQSVVSRTYNYENTKIGYIGVGIFASNTYEQFKKELNSLEKENIHSLIIDLRSNSGGYLSVAERMTSLFLDSGHVIYQTQKDNKATKHYSKGKETKKYPIVVLVNSHSASASEIMASALSEQYGATLIGVKTFGKGTVQELQTLANGDQFKLTTKNWLTSKGVWIDEKGINPDIEIILNDKYYEDPIEANDNQLQKALIEAKK